MGFDLYSTGKHKSEKGEYFRNNVWWWRPLWDWTYEQCQDILSDKEYERGTYNDCYAIDGERANKIADRLLDRLDDARAYRIAMEKDHKPKQKFNDLLTKAAEIYYNDIVNKQNGKITCPADLKELDAQRESCENALYSGSSLGSVRGYIHNVLTKAKIQDEMPSQLMIESK